MEKVKVLSLFAGVGGTCLGFKRAGFDIVCANEIDSKACQTYRLNFDNDLVEGDLRSTSVMNKLLSYDFDLLIAGFPCQPFSIAGCRCGISTGDSRSLVINNVFEIIDLKKPKVVMLENVPNLLNTNGGMDFKYIKDTFISMGYSFNYSVLDSNKLNFSRQVRKRLYIVAMRDVGSVTDFNFDSIIGDGYTDPIDTNNSDEKLIYTKEKYPKYFTSEMNLNETVEGSIYQIRRNYIRKLQTFPTLTANMGTGGHNVPLIKLGNKIRKLSPRECFNSMGFDSNFKLPTIADSHLYKQAGNSVIVPLITSLAREIGKLLDTSNKH